jgi:hypothetical protein
MVTISVPPGPDPDSKTYEVRTTVDRTISVM